MTVIETLQPKEHDRNRVCALEMFHMLSRYQKNRSKLNEKWARNCFRKLARFSHLRKIMPALNFQDLVNKI